MPPDPSASESQNNRVIGKPFLPGNPGGPGRPKGSISISEKLRQIVSRPVSEFPGYVKLAAAIGIPPAEVAVMKVGEMVAHAAILQAVKGKPQVIAEVFDRVDGRVPQEVRDEGRLGVSEILDLVRAAGVAEDVMRVVEDRVADAGRSVRVKVDFSDR